MGFQFSLAAVLRVRESVEKREERALQTIQFELSRVLHAIEELRAAMARAHRAREQALRQPIPAGQLHAFHAEEQADLETQKALHQRRRLLEQQRDEQIGVYRAALRDREMLTGMLEQQRDAYDLEQVRTQQKHIDDIFSARRQRG